MQVYYVIDCGCAKKRKLEMQYGDWCDEAKEQLEHMCHAHSNNFRGHPSMTWDQVKAAPISCWSLTWEKELIVPARKKGTGNESGFSEHRGAPPPAGGTVDHDDLIFRTLDRIERKLDWLIQEQPLDDDKPDDESSSSHKQPRRKRPRHAS